MPKQAKTDDEVLSCFEVMAELRPHLDRATFLSTVRAMESEGFKLAFIEENGQVVAVSGFRIYTNLFMGKHLHSIHGSISTSMILLLQVMLGLKVTVRR